MDSDGRRLRAAGCWPNNAFTQTWWVNLLSDRVLLAAFALRAVWVLLATLDPSDGTYFDMTWYHLTAMQIATPARQNFLVSAPGSGNISAADVFYDAAVLHFEQAFGISHDAFVVGGYYYGDAFPLLQAA